MEYLDRGLFFGGIFNNVWQSGYVRKIGCEYLARLARHDETARNVTELVDSAREAGFSVEVYSFYRSFIVLVTAESVLLVSFTLDGDGILTESSYYPEDLVSSEEEVSRGYFERLMDWYTDPSNTP